MLPQKTNVLMQYKEWVNRLTLICSYCVLHSSINRSGGGSSSSSDKITEVIKIIINPIFI